MQSADWRATARLLRRTGFGTTGPAVDGANRVGIAAHVPAILRSDPTADIGARRTPVPTFDAITPLGQSASKKEKQQRNQQIRSQLSSLTAWWIRRMVAVEEPFGEKLTFLWHNHFATAATKVRRPGWLAAQNETLRRAGRGDFRTLALAMLTDPAMLLWLDGQKNTATAPNENLSREFMELFALGHGDGYTENDVREGARALTGWRFRPNGTAYLSARAHDDRVKTVLGVIGNLDTTGFCDAVSGPAGFAPFRGIAVVVPAGFGEPAERSGPRSAGHRLRDQRDLRSLLTAMLTSADFVAAYGTIVIGPVEWLIGAIRALRVPMTDDAAARKAGGGAPDLGPVAVLPAQRQRLAVGTGLALDRGGRRCGCRPRPRWPQGRPGRDPRLDRRRVDAVAHLLGVGSWSARQRRCTGRIGSGPAPAGRDRPEHARVPDELRLHGHSSPAAGS